MWCVCMCVLMVESRLDYLLKLIRLTENVTEHFHLVSALLLSRRCSRCSHGDEVQFLGRELGEAQSFIKHSSESNCGADLHLRAVLWDDLMLWLKYSVNVVLRMCFMEVHVTWPKTNQAWKPPNRGQTSRFKLPWSLLISMEESSYY